MTPLAIHSVGAQPLVGLDLVVERMLKRLRQGDALRWLVLEHVLDEVKKENVIFLIGHLVALERLAVLTHVAAGRALLVPVQPTVVKVLGLGFPTHSAKASEKTELASLRTKAQPLRCQSMTA